MCTCVAESNVGIGNFNVKMQRTIHMKMKIKIKMKMKNVILYVRFHNLIVGNQSYSYILIAMSIKIEHATINRV